MFPNGFHMFYYIFHMFSLSHNVFSYVLPCFCIVFICFLIIFICFPCFTMIFIVSSDLSVNTLFICFPMVFICFLIFFICFPMFYYDFHCFIGFIIKHRLRYMIYWIYLIPPPSPQQPLFESLVLLCVSPRSQPAGPGGPKASILTSAALLWRAPGS